MSQQWEKLKLQGAKRMLVYRIEPTYMEGKYIGGYLTRLPATMELDDVARTIRKHYGGGGYNIFLTKDDGGDAIGSTRIELSGLPIMPKRPCNCPLERIMAQGCGVSWHV